LPVLTEKQLGQLELWLRSVLWESILPGDLGELEKPTFEIHRVKGRISLQNGSVRLLQGVREIFELLEEADVAADSDKTGPPDNTAQGTVSGASGKIVIIGRGLDKDVFEHSLRTAF